MGLRSAAEVVHQQHEVGAGVGLHRVRNARGEHDGVRRVDAEALGADEDRAGPLERLDGHGDRRGVLGQQGALTQHDGDELERGLVDEDTRLARLTRTDRRREVDDARGGTPEGGSVLLGGPAARAEAGHVVPFVLAFNFAAGFVYVAAGAATLAGRAWAAWLALALASSTLLVFAAFGVHVTQGGAFEARTVVAMTMRSAFWVVQSLTLPMLLRRGRAA